MEHIRWALEQKHVLEQKKMAISKMIEENDRVIVNKSYFYFTNKKRNEIIEMAISQGISRKLVQNLQDINEKWEKEKITCEDIEFYISFENLLYQPPSKTKISIIKKLINYVGGKGND